MCVDLRSRRQMGGVIVISQRQGKALAWLVAIMAFGGIAACGCCGLIGFLASQKNKACQQRFGLSAIAWSRNEPQELHLFQGVWCSKR
jgi:hypothetical protein